MSTLSETLFNLVNTEFKAAEEELYNKQANNARVHIRRGCVFIIDYWLENNSRKNWGKFENSIFKNLKEDYSIPREIRACAQRLTERSESNLNQVTDAFEMIKDGKTLANYFWNLIFKEEEDKNKFFS